MDSSIDRVELSREAAEARAANAWAHVVAACEFNDDLWKRVSLGLKLDWRRTAEKVGGSKKLDVIFRAVFCWEWWAVVGYRFGYWVHARKFPDLGRARWLMRLLYSQQAVLLYFSYVVNKILEGLSGARLNPTAEIGPGLLLMHTGSCGIGAGVQIGDWFTMHQDANVIGPGPVIGKTVVLYSGARVFGNVRIGDNARIGANAVVLHDLPGDCVALGVPARAVAKGERAPDYPAAEQVRDLVESLVQGGFLMDVGEGVYLDVGTGAKIRLDLGSKMGK